MKSDLLKRLKSINKAADFLGIMFHQENEPLTVLLKECGEALEEMTSIFPKKCCFCVGCELEENPNNSCPAFILSPSRAKSMMENLGGLKQDYQEDIKPTNADRIRAMTDEEIAHFLSQFADCCICKAEYGEGCSQGKKCEDFWLSWVKQEVEI